MSPKLVAKVQQEDFDSGISSVAFVENSSSSVIPSQLLDSNCSNFGQIVPLGNANQMNLPIASSSLFNMQHVILQSFGPKPFKFYSYWLEHKDFLNWVKEG